MTARLTTFAIASILLAGCKGAGDDPGDPGDAPTEAGLETVDTTANEGALLAAMMPVASAAKPGTDPVAVAAEDVPTFWSPAGCATASRSGATVTYTLAGCTGPWGLLDVTGSIAVTYEAIGDAVRADATATGLEVNGATLDLAAEAIRSRIGALVEIAVTSHTEGVGAYGTTFTRDGDYVFGVEGTDCWALDGEWATTLGARAWTTTVADYGRCVASCPDAGATITFASAASSLTISFDGSDQASWTGSGGGGGAISLACGGA